MATTATLEGVKKAVFFPFRGRNWGLKVLIGAALYFANAIIPIIPLIPMYGYFGQIMKRIILQDEDPEMPEWKDWGGLFTDGIKLAGATIIYLLPALILVIGGYILFFVLDFSMVFSFSQINTHSSNPFPPSMPLSMAGMFIGIAIALIGMVLMYISLIFVPPALGNMIKQGNFSAAFHIREWWPVFKSNLSGYLLALAIATGLFSLMYILGIFLYSTVVLCFLLPIAFGFIIFIAGAINFSLYAVAYRDSLKKLAEQPA
jgi:hypothetical protein